MSSLAVPVTGRQQADLAFMGIVSIYLLSQQKPQSTETGKKIEPVNCGLGNLLLVWLLCLGITSPCFPLSWQVQNTNPYSNFFHVSCH